MIVKTDCPLPKLDFDIITLGHGSGGLLTHKLLDAGVFDLFNNEYLDPQHDGAILNLNGETAFTTDSFVVTPVFFPDSDIGDLAINGTVNDLAMCGAIPEYISLSFILEEGLRMEEFWEILVSIKFASEKAGVKIVTGDTKVVDRGKADKIFINTSGVGRVHKNADISPYRVKPGDAIIVSGELANHGITIMSLREGLEFETDVKSDTQCLNHVVKALLDDFGDNIHLLRDPTRGGVATVLKEIAMQAKVGMKLNHETIPVNEQVDGACEMLGLDPLYVANEGLFVAIVEAEIKDEFLNMLKSHEEGRNASLIGTVSAKNPGHVLCTTAIGGSSLLNLLPGEQLPRIC